LEEAMSAEMNSAQERLGRAITVLRAERRLQRKTLAAQVGLSYVFLCDIESGKRGMSRTSLAALAEAFGLMPSDLLRRADQMPLL
jgi:transcriptional regulator with XRE-family HTH domain